MPQTTHTASRRGYDALLVGRAHATLCSARRARDLSSAHVHGLPIRYYRGFAGTGGIFSFSG